VILRNALKTPDGTIIESTYRHDYVTHNDANGKQYMVDGGLDYLRRSAHGDEVDMSIESSDNHEHNRVHFKWGTYGKDGKGPFQRKALSDLTTNHIKAILKTQPQISDEIRSFFEAELKHRGE